MASTVASAPAAAAVPGGVQRCADQRGRSGQRGVPGVEQPVDNDGDGHAEGQADQEGEPGQCRERGSAQTQGPTLAGHLGAGAADPPTTSGGQIAAEDEEAHEYQDQ